MATYKRPGTYVEEVLLPQQVESAGLATAVGCMIGSASRGPTDPTFITSWTQFTQLYGTFSTSTPLHFAVFSFFSNGGRQLYIKRVVGASNAAATVTLTDRSVAENATLVVNAINPGAWANASTIKTGLSVEVVASDVSGFFNVIVYQGGTTTPYRVETFADLSMNPDETRYVARIINSQSTFIRVTVPTNATSAPDNRPAIAGVKSLSSGANGSTPTVTNYTAAIDSLDEILQSLVLNIPDAITLSDSDLTTLTNYALAYAQDRDDVFVVVDTKDVVPADALTFATGLTKTSFGAVYYPWLTTPDPLGSLGATRIMPPGGAVMGQFLANDAIYGVAKAPAGIQSPLSNVISTARRLTNANLESLNSASAPVNAIRPVPGAGICIMGARTLKPGQSDKYVNVRRALIYLKKSMKDLTAFAIFQNNDQRLWDQLRTTLGVFLNTFWQGGGLRGATPAAAYFVKCDGTLNTQAVIDAGEVRIQVGVALQNPAEFIVISLGQFQGGTTVTEG